MPPVTRRSPPSGWRYDHACSGGSRRALSIALATKAPEHSGSSASEECVERECCGLCSEKSTHSPCECVRVRTPTREQVDGSCWLLCVHAASRNFFGLQPTSSFLQPRVLGTTSDTIHRPCSGASYYCGQPILGASAPPGCVEAAWRSPRAGTAPRESTATAKASRTCPHLEREPANPRVARPMCAHSTLTSRRTKRSLHACALCRRVLRYRVHARRPGAAASSKSSPRHCPSSGARLLRLLRAALGRVRYS